MKKIPLSSTERESSPRGQVEILSKSQGELFDCAQIGISQAAQAAMDQAWLSKSGLPMLLLMEQAAASAFHFICQQILEQSAAAPEQYYLRRGEEKIEPAFLVFAGFGNNAGDAWALARQLRCISKNISVVDLAAGKNLSEDAERMRRSAKNLGLISVDLQEVGQVENLYASLVEEAPASIIIDGILGTGFDYRRGLSPVLRETIDLLNNLREAGATVLSLDLPSAVSADLGLIAETAVKADYTLTFAFAKQGLFMRPAASYAGQIKVLPMGIFTDPESLAEIPTKLRAITPPILKNILPQRREDSHKGCYGRVTIFAGSEKMPGALLLTAESALRAGAGYVEIVSEQESAELCLKYCPEVLLKTPLDLAALTEQIARSSVIVAGPGWGRADENYTYLPKLLASKARLILDADALNIISEEYLPVERRLLLKARAEGASPGEIRTILSPHPGEFERLAPDLLEKYGDNVLKAVQTFAEESSAILLYKSSRSFFALPDGRTLVLPRSCPGLARAGSGDVLSGLIAALWARGMAAEEALALAIYLHERTAEILSADSSPDNMRVADLSRNFYRAVRELEQI